jgi:hypothetical protein
MSLAEVDAARIEQVRARHESKEGRLAECKYNKRQSSVLRTFIQKNIPDTMKIIDRQGSDK